MDVWQIALDDSGGLDIYLDVLDDQERDRASRFRFDKHMRQYVVAHAATRSILASYCGLGASDLIFEHNAYGKPFISNDGGPTFNLSHSDGFALCAVARSGEIGVDIEKCRAIDCMEMSERFFSDIERSLLENLPPEQKINGFFACWTRKEAYIKAKGLGLSLPLDSFSVDPNPNLPAALLSSDFSPSDIEKIQMWDVPTPDGFKGALVYFGSEQGPPKIKLWECRKSGFVTC